MRVSIRKTVVAAVAALGMATAVATISTPAEAQWHGGGGGFHGGGFHGGGFGGGGFHGGGWRRLGRRRLAWRRLGRRLAWRLGPARMGRRRLGLAARWAGVGLGRRLLELRLGLGRRLGLGLGSGLGDRGGDRARRGRDRFAAGLWRRSRLLGQAAGLDSERPLSGPAAGEHLQLTSAGGRSMTWFQVKASKTIKLSRHPECLFSIYCEHLFRNASLAVLRNKSRFGAQATPRRQTAAGIRRQV